MDKATQAAPEATQDPVLAAITKLAAKIEDFTGRLDNLETKVAHQAQAVPRFQPMAREGVNAPKADLSGLTRIGQQIDRTQTIPQVADGFIAQGYRPAFQQDQVVRIRRDSELGQRLLAYAGKRKFDLATEGVIVGFHIISAHNGQAKYRVRFSGLTKARGDGFWESELEAA